MILLEKPSPKFNLYLCRFFYPRKHNHICERRNTLSSMSIHDIPVAGLVTVPPIPAQHSHILMCLGQTTSKVKQWLCPKAFLGYQSCFSLCTGSSRNSRIWMALLPILGAALNQQSEFMEETALFPRSLVGITVVHILYYPSQFSNEIEPYLLILFLTHYMAQRWLEVD